MIDKIDKKWYNNNTVVLGYKMFIQGPTNLARLQIRLLSVIHSDAGRIENTHYVTVNDLVDIFYEVDKEQVNEQVQLLINEGYICKVGFLNRLVSPRSLHDGEDTQLRLTDKAKAYLLSPKTALLPKEPLQPIVEKSIFIDHSLTMMAI